MYFKRSTLSNEVSSYRTLLKVIGIIAFWEAIIMLALESIQFQNHILEVILDTVVLSLLSGTSIWLTIYLPEQKRQSRKNNHLLQQLVHALDQIAIFSIIDSNGKIQHVNENFCSISGYSDKELIGFDYRITNPDYYGEDLLKKILSTPNSIKPYRTKVRNQKKNGDYYWVDSCILPIQNERNEVEKIFRFQFDTTEENLVAMALDDEKIKNIHMARLTVLGEMAGGIAHEINNPLAVINLFVSSIEQKLRNTDINSELPKIFETIEKVQKQVVRISKIISGLREFSRTDDELKHEYVKFQQIIEAVENLCSEKLKNSGVKFEVHYDDLKFKCNAIQVEQVLVNLIGNALDAIQNNDEKWIHVNCKQIGDFAKISVTDSGHGIPTDIAKKIMEPFFTTKEVGKGTGLGLSISKNIIERHGGTLETDLRCINTRFVIQIPLFEEALLSLIDAEQAISSHITWRKKLLDLLASPQSEVDFEKLSAGNQCSLGKWIEKIEPVYHSDVNFKELSDSHTKFHLCAGVIAKRIKEGDHSVSAASFGSGSEYDMLSNKVIVSLQNLKATAIRQAA